MYKDKLKVCITVEREQDDVESVLHDCIKGINAIHQWSISSASGGEADYEITVWKGFEGVSVDKSFEDFVEEDSRVHSGHVVDYWESIRDDS